MTWSAERLLFLAAVGINVFFLAGISGWRPSAGGHRIASGGSAGTFHGGKPAMSGIRDSRCGSEKCHSAYPHDLGPESAFRNMHVEFVECPACHEREGEPIWNVERDAGNRWIIRAESPPDSGDPHAGFGAPVRCRGCHSERGRTRIEQGTRWKLPGSFHNPVALRMLEEGSRSWIPDGM